jgi:hypothetical protein
MAPVSTPPAIPSTKSLTRYHLQARFDILFSFLPRYSVSQPKEDDKKRNYRRLEIYMPDAADAPTSNQAKSRYVEWRDHKPTPITASTARTLFNRDQTFTRYYPFSRTDSSTKESIEVLDDLADQVADDFESHRQPYELKDILPVIDNSV